MSPKGLFLIVAVFCSATVAQAQDALPEDNGLGTYHTSPRYRESESHPLRIISYVLHPVGWLAREVVLRPFSYFAASTETTRSIFGYREPFDYRQPDCFTSDGAVPDCRTISPYNYEGANDGMLESGEVAAADISEVAAVSSAPADGDRQVYFPDVNFDFNARALNDLGRGRVHQIAGLLKNNQGLNIVLQGHADSVGGDSYNEKLGLDRAEAVRQELVALGVSSANLSSVTFGKTQPALAGDEAWARAVNRRVEAHVGGEGSSNVPTGGAFESPAG